MTETNTGNYNTGYYNTGYYNTGDYNTGYYNTGYYNTGDYNTGDYNTGDYNTGAFCTTTPQTILVFDTERSQGSQVNRTAFYNSLPSWLYSINPTKTDGDMQRAYAQAWGDSEQDIEAVEAILGFNRDAWIEITGLDLWTAINPIQTEIDSLRKRLEELEATLINA